MPKTVYDITEDRLKGFIDVINEISDERQRRLLLSSLSVSLGRGSATLISELSGLSQQTISAGKKELNDIGLDTCIKERHRVRAEGGGRKSLVEHNPELLVALRSIMEGDDDPTGNLMWTLLSTRSISNMLKDKGFDIGHSTVAKLLSGSGFSLQQNKKCVECSNTGSDREEQFRFIESETRRLIEKGLPVLSIDARKREDAGSTGDSGPAYCSDEDSRHADGHDLLHAIPFGIYDPIDNGGFANVGICEDTARSAVHSIRNWWYLEGRCRYPEAKEVMIVCDGSGSNEPGGRLWRYGLQELADDSGLTINVRYLPPGTFKWKRAEHRQFSLVSMNCGGRPLRTLLIKVDIIGSTSNNSGLKVRYILDECEYGIGAPISEFDSIDLQRTGQRGDWNYTLSPRSID